MVALLSLIFVSGALTAYGAYDAFTKKCSMKPFNIHAILTLILMFVLLIFSFLRLRNTLKNKLDK